MAKTFRMELVLDEADYRDLQQEIERRVKQPGRTTTLIGSNLPGAMVAEIVRDLWEFRKVFKHLQRTKV